MKFAVFRRLLACCLLLASCALPFSAWAVDTDGDGFDDVGGVILYSTSFDTADAGWSGLSGSNGPCIRGSDTMARTPSFVASCGSALNNPASTTFSYTLPQAARISFWAKYGSGSIGSAQFYIDNVSVGSFYSGMGNYYKQFSFPAGVGGHQFKWTVKGSGIRVVGVIYFDDVSITTIKDNCATLANVDQLDTDKDGQGDACDTDDDNDGVLDGDDNCPLNANSSQADTDADGLPDACTDTDDDNDGVADVSDKFPLDANESLDTDNDGIGNNADTDDDNDGIEDGSDNCPLHSNLDQLNTDGDAQGNACDADDDNDGVADTSDKFPLNPSVSSDTDNDGFPNSWNATCDVTCQNNSGLVLDNCPGVSNADQLNTDGDAQGNACDADDDNDGVGDVSDTYPLDSARSLGDSNILRHFNGDNVNDDFGRSVSNAGDVNGDGYADVIVGAYLDDNNGTDSGLVRVFSGLDGSILYTFNGDSATDYFGQSVSGAGDVNGDGYADVIVGAYQDDNNGTSSGSARVFSGLDGSILYTFNGDSAGDNFGESVSAAGDVNGDGYADVIVGANADDNNGSGSGSARVFSGADGSILYTFNGDSAADYFGGSVSGAGDVNGDGYADVIVGALYDDNNGTDSGSARVFSGADGSILFTFNGDSASDYFGFSVSGAGDVNNDSYADVIAGAFQDDNNGTDSGLVRVFSGLDGSILYTFNGDSAGDLFGYSVSGTGDVNGDGYADVIVGAFGDDNNSSGSGSARIFSGIDGSILYTFNGDSSGDCFGVSVSGAGDVNSDGYADVIVGANQDDNNGSNSGSARIFNGKGAWLDTDNDGVNDAIDNDDDADGISDIDETTIVNNVLNNLDPPIAVINSKYIVGVDNRNAESSAPSTVWNVADGALNSTETCDFCVVPGAVFTLSASDDWCGVNANGIGCMWWVMDTGDVNNEELLPLQIAGETVTPLHDWDSYLKYVDLSSALHHAVTDAFKISSDHQSHTCIVSKTLGVYCWASHSGTDIISSTVPVALQNVATVKDVAVGANHACAINGSAVQCWGDTASGKTAVPVIVNTPKQIAAGANHTCAINANGSVSCWGDNGANQLGDGNTDGVVDGVSNALRIAAGTNHTCAVTGNYNTPSGLRIKCWGDNSAGQTTVPVALTNGVEKPVNISVAGNQTCAIRAGQNVAANAMICWPVSVSVSP